MIDGLNELKANGAIRQDVDVEVLARAIHCLHVGYILSRHVFAPDRKWDDAGEIVQMAQLLALGSAHMARRWTMLLLGLGSRLPVVATSHRTLRKSDRSASSWSSPS
jgi:hypothetical protein